MAAVLPSLASSGLSSPAESQYSSTLETHKMDTTTLSQPKAFLTQKMVAVLQESGYDNSAINTLISRADSNTIEASNISAENFLGDSDSISEFLETNLLNEKKLREQDIYLNSNEPILLLGFSSALGFGIQQVRDLKENVLVVLRARGTKPVRVYVQEIEDNESAGLSFSLLNVVNSDIGVNMVSLLDAAFYGSGWKNDLVMKEAYNGYDLIWKDEVWKTVRGEEEVEVEIEEVVVENADVPVVEHDSAESQVETSESAAVPSEPVRATHYKSADDVPEDDEDTDESEPVQHPALKELLEQEAQKPGVQHPTWSRNHDGEGYIDIIKTHSGGIGAGDSEPISVISRPSGNDEKDDFEVVDKP